MSGDTGQAPSFDYLPIILDFREEEIPIPSGILRDVEKKLYAAFRIRLFGVQERETPEVLVRCGARNTVSSARLSARALHDQLHRGCARGYTAALIDANKLCGGLSTVI